MKCEVAKWAHCDEIKHRCRHGYKLLNLSRDSVVGSALPPQDFQNPAVVYVHRRSRNDWHSKASSITTLQSPYKQIRCRHRVLGSSATERKHLPYRISFSWSQLCQPLHVIGGRVGELSTWGRDTSQAFVFCSKLNH